MRPLAVLLPAVWVVWAAEPLVRVLDLDAGGEQTVKLADGSQATVKLVAVADSRDPVQNAVRSAEVRVEVNGVPARLSCGNYELPLTAGGVQIDCPVTKAYYSNSNSNHWGLEKDARLRLWPSGSPLMPGGSFGYPARQRWFATHTQMANEPTYVDRGESFRRKKIYYHSGLDIGGAEGLVEVVAATGGQVVSLGNDVLPGHEKATPVAKRYDVIYLLDERGWYYRYSHLQSFEASLKLGQRVQLGDKLGVLGKEGGSGGWSHLHFEIVSRQPSGKWGTQEGYAFLWEAYLRQYSPRVIAVARPHRVGVTGEKVVLDGRRSWSAGGRISRYEWRLSDGGAASEAVAERVYDRPGTYSEILKVTDREGNISYDFATVNVFDPARQDLEAPAIHAAFSPTTNIRAGREVTFKVRTFGTTDGEEVWDFGDGSPKATTKSDGNVKVHAPDGYAVIKHVFAKPGDYIVRVSRADARGLQAVTHLWVRVDPM